MKTPFRLAMSIIELIVLLACSMFAPRVAAQHHTPVPIVATQQPTFVPTPNRFGVYVSKDAGPNQDIVGAARQLGVGWVRLNVVLGSGDQTYVQYLASGINVVLTILNQDPSNILTDYGTPQQFFAAGFPYKSKAKYQQDVRDLLQPGLGYLKSGRQIWLQGGNEIADASAAVKEPFWRGTMQQYLDQQQALYEVVQSVNPGIPVILTSFESETLDKLIDPKAQGHPGVVKYLTGLLTQGKYDAIDLHFYGCVEDIPAKVTAVKELLPAGRTVPWISTENGGPMVECKNTPISWSQDLTQFEALQAQQVPARLSACADQDASVCLWFSLFNVKRGSDDFNHLGLLDEDTTPAREKPAYEAFKTFIAQYK